MVYRGPAGVRAFRTAIASASAIAALLLTGCDDSDTQPMLFPTGPTGVFDSAKLGGPATCDTTNTTVHVREISRPINHLVLELTNISAASCAAYWYPHLRFDDNPAAIPAMPDSRPQSVVEIAPGASAFAVLLKSAANNPEVVPAQRITITYSDRNGDETTGRVEFPLPDNTNIGRAAKVSCWQSDLQQALVW
ncbi:DUF4232 domain-containing protein [Nocardia sp. NPDC051030]|uniref:DUF4232 domain-containing protein n=1 Tax=Nocardia sp. NPDC051030 TaxID=3155162 RepID=UPI00341B5611